MLKVDWKFDKNSDEKTETVKDFPETFEDAMVCCALGTWTPAGVWHHALANMTVKIQGRLRADEKKRRNGKPVANVDWPTWVMPRETLSYAERVGAAADTMTDEEKRELIRRMEASLAS